VETNYLANGEEVRVERIYLANGEEDGEDRNVLVNEEDFFAIEDDTGLTLDTFRHMVAVTLIHEVRVPSEMVGRHVNPNCSGYMQLVPVH
jgi:hypothetical protein